MITPSRRFSSGIRNGLYFLLNPQSYLQGRHLPTIHHRLNMKATAQTARRASFCPSTGTADKAWLVILPRVEGRCQEKGAEEKGQPERTPLGGGYFLLPGRSQGASSQCPVPAHPPRRHALQSPHAAPQEDLPGVPYARANHSHPCVKH